MAATSGGGGRLKGEEVLKNQLKICGFKKDNDVTELYLGERELKEVPDLSQFHKLMYLWLNNNKILMLHNNQLKNLETTVKELKGMSLQTLNLFKNPLAQDCRYRLYVIYHLPTVLLLDRKEITIKERSLALNIYNHQKTLVLQSIGFGKRTDVPLLPKAPFSKSWSSTKVLRLPPGCEFGNHLVKIPFENPEDAVFVRAMNRSIVKYSTVNWDTVTTSEEKRLGTKPEKVAEKLTITFR
ncbi:leucine-rich repeat-containing protein 72 isoform X3 [Heteronotia binoei]|uniref:leucine-rich repeat-containing protein 72 isoform X3 n=1 Tax=Heteronotia binoei TaxID=13085 RepID=UPI00292D5A8C|nr:leucine-rich repeat-containing protein 72 isoform X3 [Heteronotia binoei]